jgi:hypothetical protein
MGCLQTIFSAWERGSDQDAWILHRSLLDRLLHLRFLADSDSFVAFDEHSFMSAYEFRHQLLSDPDMRHKAPTSVEETQKRDRPRYEKLLASNRWRRPRAEEVAKSMGLGFIYRFGYDYASTHVHPMSSDGESDFRRLTSPSQSAAPGDSTVVRNSILIQSMLVQEALNVSTLRWRNIAYTFLDNVKALADTLSPELHKTMARIAATWPGMTMCEPITEQTPPAQVDDGLV